MLFVVAVGWIRSGSIARSLLLIRKINSALHSCDFRIFKALYEIHTTSLFKHGNIHVGKHRFTT